MRRREKGDRRRPRLPVEIRDIYRHISTAYPFAGCKFEAIVDAAWYASSFEDRVDTLRRRDAEFEDEYLRSGVWHHWSGNVADSPEEPENREVENRLRRFLENLKSRKAAPLASLRVPPAILAPDFSSVSDEVIGFLAMHPEYMHELHHRKFEEMLQAVFRALGYIAEIGPGTADGGVDLRLEKHSEVGPFVVLVQAKHWRRRPVGLEVCSALYGHVENKRANKGIIATTSRFLPCARRFAEDVGHRLLLAEPADIAGWLKHASKRQLH